MDETMSGVGATWADASVLKDVRRLRAEPMRQNGADFGAAVIHHVQRTGPAIGPDLSRPVQIRDTGFELIEGEQGCASRASRSRNHRSVFSRIYR
jgi:hypothetical protein